MTALQSRGHRSAVRFTGLNASCWQSCAPSGGRRGESSFQHSLACGLFYLMPAMALWVVVHHNPDIEAVICFFHSPRTPVMALGPLEKSGWSPFKGSWLIPFPVTSHTHTSCLKVPGLRRGHLWRGCYYLLTTSGLWEQNTLPGEFHLQEAVATQAPQTQPTQSNSEYCGLRYSLTTKTWTVCVGFHHLDSMPMHFSHKDRRLKHSYKTAQMQTLQ